MALICNEWFRDQFQSTRPVRGETESRQYQRERKSHFNPLAPCGARRVDDAGFVSVQRISIHSPRAGRDKGSKLITLCICQNFNPLAPCGARPVSPEHVERQNRYFNPLAPCGARPAGAFRAKRCGIISIHSPRAGRDLPAASAPCPSAGISIHSPRAGRDLLHAEQLHGVPFISIHSPRAGRDYFFTPSIISSQ